MSDQTDHPGSGHTDTGHTDTGSGDSGLGLDPAARARLAAACDRIAAEPARIRTLFPAAARDIARSAPSAPVPGEVRLEDTARIALLEALATALGDGEPGADKTGAVEPGALEREVRDLYRFGDADERRAVLYALPRLGLGQRARDLVDDALRTNDTRLVAAAMGAPGAELLDDEAWRQGVLKCLFVGVPLDVVAALEQRTDAELLRMVDSFAAERSAAGRAIPDDARRLLAGTTEDQES